MRVLPVTYRGQRFRSRLEARWACFFDSIGVDWVYEREGFDLGGIYYLPDFWLIREKLWVEVKGEYPDSDALLKAFRLAQATGHDVMIVWGEPIVKGAGFDVKPLYDGMLFSPREGSVYVEEHVIFHRCRGCDNLAVAPHPEIRGWLLHKIYGPCSRKDGPCKCEKSPTVITTAIKL